MNVQPTLLLIDRSTTARGTHPLLLPFDQNSTYRIVQVDSVATALQRYQEARPDVVCWDVSGGKEDGVDYLAILHLLRQQTWETPIPVIVLVSQGQEAIASWLVQNGAQHYLVKESLTSELLNCIIQRAIEWSCWTRQINTLQAVNRELEQRLEQQTQQLETAPTRSQENEQKLRQLTENLAEVFWLRDSDNQLVHVSPCYERVWGQSIEYLMQNPSAWSEVIHPEDKPRVLAADAQKFQYAYDEAYRIIRPDGEMRWIRDRTFPIQNQQGKTYWVLGIAEDITAHKQVETALHSSEVRFQSLVANVPGVIFQCCQSPEGTRNFTYISPRCQDVFEVEASILQQNVQVAWNMVDSEDVQPLHEAMALAKQQMQPLDREFRIIPPSGKLKWLRIIAQPVLAPAGEVVWDGLIMDISDRQQAEANTLKALAKEKELNELKSRFISNTSHEFRTPLTTILGSTELLQHLGEQWTPAKKEKYYQQIKTAVQHMTQIMDDILTFGEAEAGELLFHPVPLNLITFCLQIIDEIRASSQHILQFHPPPSCPVAHLDEKLLRYILKNILSNAIKYSPEGSLVQIHLTFEAATVILQVKDQGIGIPKADLIHLFKPFHRAQNIKTIAGTGLGLAIVKQAVDLHQGEVFVESQVGMGTLCTVKLPLHPP